MFFLGIDIGKYSHVASLIDDKKKVIFKAFSFSNSIEGANSFFVIKNKHLVLAKCFSLLFCIYF